MVGMLVAHPSVSTPFAGSLFRGNRTEIDRMKRLFNQGLTAMCLALALSSCAGGLSGDKRAATERIEAYIATQPTLDPETTSEMRAFRLRNGMSEAEVRATWGAPENVFELSDNSAEWRFSCAFPHLCRSRPGGPAIKPNAFFIDGKLDRWNH